MMRVPKLFRSQLVSGASVYLTANLINAAIPFFLLPVMTRYLEPAEYGEVAVFMVWVSLIGALCGLSVHGAAIRKYYDYAEPDKEIGEFVTACLLLLTLSSIVLFIIVAPISGRLAQLIGLSQGWLLVGVLFAFCNFLIQLRLGQWQVRKQPKKYGTFQVLQSALNISLSLILVVVLGFGMDGRVGGYTASVTIFGLLAILSMNKHGLVKWNWRPDLMKEAAKFGVPLIPHVVGTFFLITVDRAIISSKLGTEDAGYYMVAVQFGLLLWLLIMSIHKAYTPWLYERLKGDIHQERVQVVKLTYLLNVSYLLIALLMFIIGDEMVTIVAGEKYTQSSEIVAWLVLGQAFRGMYATQSGYIYFTKNTKAISLITIFSGIIHVFLTIMLIDFYGLVGVAYSFCISTFIQFYACYIFARKYYPMPSLYQIYKWN